MKPGISIFSRLCELAKAANAVHAGSCGMTLLNQVA